VNVFPLRTTISQYGSATDDMDHARQQKILSKALSLLTKENCNTIDQWLPQDSQPLHMPAQRDRPQVKRREELLTGMRSGCHCCNQIVNSSDCCEAKRLPNCWGTSTLKRCNATHGRADSQDIGLEDTGTFAHQS
jgi:hypothetical protein